MSEMPQKRVCFLSAAHRLRTERARDTHSAHGRGTARARTFARYVPRLRRVSAPRASPATSGRPRVATRGRPLSFRLRVGATRWDARRTPTASGVRTSRSARRLRASLARCGEMGTVAASERAGERPPVAPARLRETVTPVPPEVLAAGRRRRRAARHGGGVRGSDRARFPAREHGVPGSKVLHDRPPPVTAWRVGRPRTSATAHKRREGFGRDATSALGGARRAPPRRTCERHTRARSTPSY